MVIKTNKFSVMGAAMAAMLVAGQAQAANSVDATASVEIAAPISITEDTQLSFGNIGPSASAGTVTITNAGARSVTGGVSELGGAFAAAEFTVTGASGANFNASIPTSASLTGPGDAMSVSLTNDAGTSISGGSVSFNVGGTLSVGANQAAGSYSGTYTITVNYQ